MQEKVENVDVDAPVFLDLFQTEETCLSAVLSKTSGQACAATDGDGVNAEGGEDACDAVQKRKRGVDVREILRLYLQMHLAVAEDPLGGHVLGDATDTAGGFEDDLGARGGGFKAEEAISVDENLEMAFYC